MDINTMIMGRNIRLARKQRNMAAEDLAGQIGVTAESLRHIECGVRKTSLQTLYAIAEVLDVSMDYLVGRGCPARETFVRDGVAACSLTAEQERLLMELVRSMIPVIKNRT